MKPVLNYLVSGILFILFIFTLSSCSRKVALQGKLIVPEGKLKYFANESIVLKNSFRPVKRTKIDQFGFFEFKNVRLRKNYTVCFDSLLPINDEPVYYVAKINGEKIRQIHFDKKFRFKLLHPDMVALSSMGDDDLDVMLDLFKKDSSVNELRIKKYINYETDSFRIAKPNRRYIRRLARILKENKNFVLYVNSHADAKGDDANNLLLSLKRANEIKKYLVSRGISPERIFATGYGETMPLNECVNGVVCSELQHWVNRRTEFVFKTTGKKRMGNKRR